MVHNAPGARAHVRPFAKPPHFESPGDDAALSAYARAYALATECPVLTQCTCVGPGYLHLQTPQLA
eukprot:936754-Rhodomonas_salina.3